MTEVENGDLVEGAQLCVRAPIYNQMIFRLLPVAANSRLEPGLQYDCYFAMQSHTI